jgi:Cys-tRNA(Pro)/Cys-tRNA(Cys) deacylase
LSIVTSVVATARTVSAVTPAVSVVQKAGVTYVLHEYEHEPGARSFGDEAVEKLGWDAARVFKTLVVSVDGALHVACVPVSAQLDLKALGKRARLADKEQAHGATGYVTGGTSPLGQRKRLPTHIDSSALEHRTILVNGGRRGLQLELDPNDLVRLTDARVHEIASRP